jgi:hypothetical protein
MKIAVTYMTNLQMTLGFIAIYSSFMAVSPSQRHHTFNSTKNPPKSYAE